MIHTDRRVASSARRAIMRRFARASQRTPHDLGLFVRQDARGARGDLVYNAQRFSPELAARAAARLAELIAANRHRAVAADRRAAAQAMTAAFAL